MEWFWHGAANTDNIERNLARRKKEKIIKTWIDQKVRYKCIYKVIPWTPLVFSQVQGLVDENQYWETVRQNGEPILFFRIDS